MDPWKLLVLETYEPSDKRFDSGTHPSPNPRSISSGEMQSSSLPLQNNSFGIVVAETPASCTHQRTEQCWVAAKIQPRLYNRGCCAGTGGHWQCCCDPQSANTSNLEHPLSPSVR